MIFSLSRRTRQRLAGWICAASQALSVMASPAPGASFLHPNGQVTRNAYDATGRLLERALYAHEAAATAGNFQSRFVYEYDATGNVTRQTESWPGSLDRAQGERSTQMTYDDASRLVTETIDDPDPAQDMTTVYGYDAANNRISKYVSGGGEPGYWTYTHNSANQLTSWTKWTAVEGGVAVRTASFTYDANGNRKTQVITGTEHNGAGIAPANVENGTTTYVWDFMNRLVGVTMASGRSFAYQYDYRSRRVGITDVLGQAKHTAISFSEGLSVAEWETTGGTGPVVSGTATVQYVRGTDMGGGIGGMLYSLRDDAGTLKPKYDLSNGRGDVVAQSDTTGSLTWTASYEAFGRRTTETGVNEDKQRANTKDEDPTGLLNEGFRYRDLETGVFLSRDPAGTVDGPNVYTYVNQNPWTKFDPEGLFWHIAAAGLIGAAISVGAQVVSDVVAGKMSDASTYAGAAAGGAVTGATLAATGSPTLAGAAGGAAASATQQFVANGTVDGGQVLKDAAVGAVGGGLGGAGSRALGCGANKALKALGGAAADAISGAGAQVAENVLNGDPPGQGVANAALGSLPGAGIVTAVQQRETCFLAGTSVTPGTGDHQAIETLRIGQRVLTPESAQGSLLSPLSGSETQVDPATWRSYKVRLRDARTGWDMFDITLLRPAGWMAEHARQVAGCSEVWVDFEELHAKGWAEVIEERACPKIAEGPGRVITATITHANDDVRTLTMSSGEVLYVTGNHRMYSATRQNWVPVKDLRIGEELRTTKGRESVAALGYQRGRHQVYNLEVETEHCYFVGNGEVLTHNTCGVSLTDSPKGGVVPNNIGKAGEDITNGIYGAKNTESFAVNGRDRVPDHILAQDVQTRKPTIVEETKNVGYQHLSTQIKDSIDLVGPDGKVALTVRKDTKISKPLLNHPQVEIRRDLPARRRKK